VGVVGDTKQLGLGEEIRMQTYIPVSQDAPSGVRLAVRAAAEPMSLVAPTKFVVHGIDPDLPIYEIETIDEAIGSSVAPHRFATALLAVFAGMALVLAAIGLYGVITSTVARRTQELAVRVAMGAKRTDIFRLVMHHGLIPSLLGALGGVLGALGLTRFLSSLLYGVGAKDPLTFVAVPVMLTAVAFLACAVTALAATRVDPIRALKYE
jgi:putative ABC transport system permease protein